jgi:hypothetical protein
MAMQNHESPFLSEFLLQSQHHERIAVKEYRMASPPGSFKASWARLGIPEESPARRRQTEPRLAKAILQALANTDSI